MEHTGRLPGTRGGSRIYPWFELMDRAIETSYPEGELDIYDRYQLERFMGFTLGNIYCGVIPLNHCLDVLEQGMASYLLSAEKPMKIL